ncbi:immune inhibitor A domain-containing protein [Bacillus sp. TL12]|uniref:immune inhibitor A domain-containing protein n=1 Tax=Bacillus sp. TL12 TaxID=2894756 RepID=UPI001F51915C|nr:immune inhibitor A domain-containing protein [Bacillus sp. TL12]MCI0766708.1 immune inhibitor A [Bacillus sp. TL12]
MLSCTFILITQSHVTYAEKSDQVYKTLSTIQMDDNVINEDRLGEALKERGIINENASKEETAKVVENYIDKKRGESLRKESISYNYSEKVSDFIKKEKEVTMNEKKKMQQKIKNERPLPVPPTSKKNMNKQVPTAPAKQAAYNGPVRTDKVLVLLVEFNDFKHNNIDQKAGYMYSQDFSREHYQKMLFGNEPYTLYNNAKVQTFKQYYQEQSGGSYDIEGYVTEWLTVPGKAADYGADDKNGRDNKGPLGPRDLVKEALKVAAEKGLDLSQFDQYDRYDMNGDGNLNEPDGVIDHLMVIHAGVGQEAGGGKLGDNAIWSHRSNLDIMPYAIEGTKTAAPYWGGAVAAYDYTIEPEDGAVGVFAHEFGHDLGLPDEYDTNYTGNGSPVEAWSLMSGGSWTGRVAGTEPTSFSPQNKEFLQKNMGGNWANIIEIDYDNLKKGIGYATYLDQSVTKSVRPGLIRINLPDKDVENTLPKFGKKYYYSMKGNDLHTTLETPLFDLTKATSIKFDYKTFYEIETNYDFLNVYVITKDGRKALIDKIGNKDVVDGKDTTNNTWIDKSYDLNQFKGQKVKLQFEYITDSEQTMNGFRFDNLRLSVDNQIVFFDDAEGDSKCILNGFVISNGFEKKKHNYYLEWRNYSGADKGLKASKGAIYNKGLVVWYADDSFTDNWVGKHPGDGFLGVVDSHPEAIVGTTSGKSVVAKTNYQIADAAFSLEQTRPWQLQSGYGVFNYQALPGVAVFDDSKRYNNSIIPDAGRNIPNLGLKFQVVGQAEDYSAGAIWLRR